MEPESYLTDPWNYLENADIVFFFWSAYLDIVNDKVTEQMRVLFSMSILMSLVKMVYLLRVFKSLNFLVTMLSHVVKEVIQFMALFLVFMIAFAECNSIL